MFQGIIESLPMAVHAGFSNRLFHILGGMKCSLALLTLSMAGNTVDIRCKHEAGRVRNSNSPAPAV